MLLLLACSDKGTEPEVFDAAKVCPESGRGTFVDERDGQEYKYTTIGDQVWMAENLNYKTEYSVCYDNDEANCEIYGMLYSLGAKDFPLDYDKVDSVCPTGWHLPKFEEFDKMINLAGGWDNEKEIISLLRSDSLWMMGLRSSDECGFSVRPGGQFYGKAEEESYSKHRFAEINLYSFFWTQTLTNPLVVKSVSFSYDRVAIQPHSFGMSIRCIKD